jgi:hypothetical protein
MDIQYMSVWEKERERKITGLLRSDAAGLGSGLLLRREEHGELPAEAERDARGSLQPPRRRQNHRRRPADVRTHRAVEDRRGRRTFTPSRSLLHDESKRGGREIMYKE